MVVFEDLVRYCQQDDWPADVDAEHHRVRSRFGTAHGNFSVTMAADSERDLVTFLVPYYLKAPPGKLDETCRNALLELLLAINYELALGCFEYDPTDGEVRFRLAVPCDGDTFRLELFTRATEGMIWACDHFYPACQRVLWGGLTAGEALDSLASAPEPHQGPNLTEV